MMNSKKHLFLFLIFSLVIFLSSISAELRDIYYNDIAEHKSRCVAEILAHPETYNYSYPLSRVLLTTSADDADHIPKVLNAGKTFHENGISYQLMHNGVRVIKDCYYGSWMTDIIHILKGHHEPQEEKVFHEVLKYIPANSTMIELGAYWGYYSLWFSKAIAGAKNYLVEPDSNCIEIGKRNFALNNKEGVFYQGYVQLNKNDEFIFSQAKRIFIDSFLKENGIAHVNILHSDIQGAEYEMLLSSVNSILANKIDYFFVSTHSPGIHAACLNFLRKYNYIIIAEHGMHESCSVDGLIVARRKDLPGPTQIAIHKYFLTNS